jgi:hypothetical protein
MEQFTLYLNSEPFILRVIGSSSKQQVLQLAFAKLQFLKEQHRTIHT